MAIIDIGSNSVKLYLETTRERLAIVSQLYRDGMSRESMERTLCAVEALIKRAKDAGENVRILATAAARTARGGEFAAMVLSVTGFEVDILSGEMEAQCGFLGATNGKSGKHIVVDIGGASTEISSGTIKPDYKISLDIGAVKLSEMQIEGLPSLNAHIDSLLAAVEKQSGELILIGGTASFLAAIKHGLSEFSAKTVHGTELSLDFVSQTVSRLLSMSAQERNELYPFLGLRRAEVFPYGAAIIPRIMTRFEKTTAHTSEHGLIEGYLLL